MWEHKERNHQIYQRLLDPNLFKAIFFTQGAANLQPLKNNLACRIENDCDPLCIYIIPVRSFSIVYFDIRGSQQLSHDISPTNMAIWHLIRAAQLHRALHPALLPGRYSGFSKPLADSLSTPIILARARGLHGGLDTWHRRISSCLVGSNICRFEQKNWVEMYTTTMLAVRNCLRIMHGSQAGFTHERVLWSKIYKKKILIVPSKFM